MKPSIGALLLFTLAASAALSIGYPNAPVTLPGLVTGVNDDGTVDAVVFSNSGITVLTRVGDNPAETTTHWVSMPTDTTPETPQAMAYATAEIGPYAGFNPFGFVGNLCQLIGPMLITAYLTHESDIEAAATRLFTIPESTIDKTLSALNITDASKVAEIKGSISDATSHLVKAAIAIGEAKAGL